MSTHCKDLEDMFKKEFKSAARLLTPKNIFSVPLPPEAETWGVVRGKTLVAIKGINDQYFGKLNKTLAYRVSSTGVKRRVIDKVNRSFLRDENGEFTYEDVSVPQGTVVIASKQSLSLPFSYVPSDIGLTYIDFVGASEKNREFLYTVPKEYVYSCSQTALALSVKNMKNFAGAGYSTWNMGIIFLHVIPYNPSAQYTGSRILKTGTTLDYSQEIAAIRSFWVKQGVIPDLRLTQLTTGENLALKQTQVGYDESDFIIVSPLSLGDKEKYGYQDEVGESSAK